MAVIDSYTGSTSGAYGLSTNGSSLVLGTTFTGTGASIANVHFKLGKTSGATGNINAIVYAATGTAGTNAVGTGSILATSDALAVSSLPITEADTALTFSGANQIAPTNGTTYIIGLISDGTGGDVDSVWFDYHVGAVAGRNNAILEGTWSADTTSIFYFVLNSVPAMPANLFFF